MLQDSNSQGVQYHNLELRSNEWQHVSCVATKLAEWKREDCVPIPISEFSSSIFISFSVPTVAVSFGDVPIACESRWSKKVFTAAWYSLGKLRKWPGTENMKRLLLF